MCLLIVIAGAGAASGAEFRGMLMDQMCAAHHSSGGKGYAAAKQHTKQCGLMPDCAKSGFGIFTRDGKYLKFDATGSQQAEAALQKSDKKDGFEVQVTGEQKGDEIAVSDLKIL
jgi:hypothetical protein